jgi:hypothetical protein
MEKQKSSSPEWEVPKRLSHISRNRDGKTTVVLEDGSKDEIPEGIHIGDAKDYEEYATERNRKRYEQEVAKRKAEAAEVENKAAEDEVKAAPVVEAEEVGSGAAAEVAAADEVEVAPAESEVAAEEDEGSFGNWHGARATRHFDNMFGPVVRPEAGAGDVAANGEATGRRLERSGEKKEKRKLGKRLLTRLGALALAVSLMAGFGGGVKSNIDKAAATDPTSGQPETEAADTGYAPQELEDLDALIEDAGATGEEESGYTEDAHEQEEVVRPVGIDYAESGYAIWKDGWLVKNSERNNPDGRHKMNPDSFSVAPNVEDIDDISKIFDNLNYHSPEACAAYAAFGWLSEEQKTELGIAGMDDRQLERFLGDNPEVWQKVADAIDDNIWGDELMTPVEVSGKFMNTGMAPVKYGFDNSSGAMVLYGTGVKELKDHKVLKAPFGEFYIDLECMNILVPAPGGNPVVPVPEKPDTGDETGTGTETGDETGTETGDETGVETGDETGTETGSETGTETGGETGTETGGETGGETGSETGNETGSETGIETGEETGSETGTETGVETGGETGSETGNETGNETGSETGVETGEETGSETGDETGIETGVETGIETGIETGDEGGDTPKTGDFGGGDDAPFELEDTPEASDDVVAATPDNHMDTTEEPGSSVKDADSLVYDDDALRDGNGNVITDSNGNIYIKDGGTGTGNDNKVDDTDTRYSEDTSGAGTGEVVGNGTGTPIESRPDSATQDNDARNQELNRPGVQGPGVGEFDI